VQIEALSVQLKREHPSWGVPKIREKDSNHRPRDYEFGARLLAVV
jgi:hypothetical protein